MMISSQADDVLRSGLAVFFRRRRMVRLCAGAGVLAAAGGLTASGITGDPVWLLGGMGGSLVLFFIAGSRWKKLSMEFKSQFVNGVVHAVHPELRYAPGSGFSEAEFNGCGLFLTRPNRYFTEDQVQGKIGKTAIRFAECNAKKVTGSGKHRRVQHIFRGVLFKADFPKAFSCSAVVLPDRAEALFGELIGGFLQKCNFVRGERIKLEDPEFEKLFSVYGDDPQEVRYLLTPSFMARLTALKKNHRCQVMCSFRHGRFYLALGNFRNVFEPPLWSTPAPDVLFDRIAGELRELTGMVEELDLNTRIWSKTSSRSAL